MIIRGRSTERPSTSPWHHHFPLRATDMGAFFNSWCLFVSPVNYLGCQQPSSPSEQSLEPVPCAWVSAADPAHPSLYLPASAPSLSAWQLSTGRKRRTSVLCHQVTPGVSSHHSL